jgi:hypothetical protein
MPAHLELLWTSLTNQAKEGFGMERWWNCVVEVTVPFDTPEEARSAFNDEATIDALFEIFGNDVVISGRIEEATDED